MGGPGRRRNGQARRSPDNGSLLFHYTTSANENDKDNDKKEAGNSNQCDGERKGGMAYRRKGWFLVGYRTLRDYGILVIVNWLFIVAIVAVVEAEGRVAQLQLLIILILFILKTWKNEENA